MQPVHSAMHEDRPEKGAMRALWAEEVRRYVGPEDAQEPWYLTLPGPSARDVKVLQDKGIVGRTEVGGIGSEHLNRVVAVESSLSAVAALKREIPGLKVIEVPVEDFLHSERPTAWPTGEHALYARAKVVNLDMNRPFEVRDDQGQLLFPVSRLIYKLAELHAREPFVEWTLCLTLHGDLIGDHETLERVGTFLKDNFAREPRFLERCGEFLGQDFVDSVRERGVLAIDELDPLARQRLLMALVPKSIASDVTHVGWRIDVSTNARYGGSDGTAPMVTWVIRFVWDPNARTEQDRIYREVIAAVLANPEEINGAGEVLPDGIEPG